MAPTRTPKKSAIAFAAVIAVADAPWIRSESDKWGHVIRRKGITAE
jgi:hypothetical protein